MNKSKPAVMEGLWYTEEHEWVRAEGDIAVIGITDHAQKELRDIVFVELPAAGDKLTARKDLGYVESTKAVNAIFSPVSGEVVEVNGNLEDNPELINTDPYGEGWMVRVRMSNKDELRGYLDAEGYSKLMEKIA
jgi:glycine cleavage system H protein